MGTESHNVGTIRSFFDRKLGRRHLLTALTGIALGGSLLQCTGSASLGERRQSSCDLVDYSNEGDGPYNPSIKITTFWKAGADLEAQNFLRDVKPHDFWPVTKEDRDALLEGLQNQWSTTAIVPPNAFQVNGGSDVLRWAYNIPENKARPASEAQLCSLNRLDDLYHWRRDFFPAAMAPATCNDDLYALPIGVHRVNLLFYNRVLLSEFLSSVGRDPLGVGDTLHLDSSEEFSTLLEEVSQYLEDGGLDGQIAPLALSGESTWPFGLLAFDSLMSTVGDAYESVWMGRAKDHSSKDIEELTSLLKESWLPRLVNISDRSNLRTNLAINAERAELAARDNSRYQPLTWRDNLELVIEGKAFFTVMGDWAWADADLYESSRSKKGPSPLRAVPFPDEEPAFVYTPDSFAIPRNAHDAGMPAHYWLKEVVSDKATQIAFSNVKQSIPPRADLDEDDLAQLDHPRVVEGYKAFRECQEEDSTCRLRLAVSGLSWSPGTNPCLNQISGLLFLATGHDLPPEDPGDSSLAEGGAPNEAGQEEAGTCEVPLPSSQAEAKRVLIERLLTTARNPFAENCRQ